jgi:hypothetical protein
VTDTVRRKGMYGVSCEAENATGKILNISRKKIQKKCRQEIILNVLKKQTKSTVVYYGILK